MSDRNALAAKYFPEEWARVENKVGASKERQQLRRRAEQHDHCLWLKENLNASCANCGFRIKARGVNFDNACSLDSDFYGYVEAKLDGICPRWGAKP